MVAASRVAVVTGGTSGIGLASAKLLADAGHIVVAGSRRATDVHVDGIHNLALDVAEPASVTEFCKSVVDRFGAPSILVNAAGIYQQGALGAPSSDHWHSQIAVNLTGPFLMTQALLPGMIANGFGRIVNIASTAGRSGAAGYGGYCASKAGLIALSKVTAIEGAPYNVTCVSISPTWVDTPMMDAASERFATARGTDATSEKAALEGSNPQNRYVKPEEIAALVAFCCAEDCPALTNEDIQVNAGAPW